MTNTTGRKTMSANRKRDLDTRKPYTTTPPTVEIFSCSKRGDKFLKDWVADDDRPTRGENGRLFIIIPESDGSRVLAQAARAGLVF
jgi:hypothetical protein